MDSFGFSSFPLDRRQCFTVVGCFMLQTYRYVLNEQCLQFGPKQKTETRTSALIKLLQNSDNDINSDTDTQCCSPLR